MKTVTFLFAIILLSACSSTVTTMRSNVVVSSVTQTKKGVQIKVRRINAPTPIPANLFKIGDTIQVLHQHK